MVKISYRYHKNLDNTLNNFQAYKIVVILYWLYLKIKSCVYLVCVQLSQVSPVLRCVGLNEFRLSGQTQALLPAKHLTNPTAILLKIYNTGPNLIQKFITVFSKSWVRNLLF